MNDDRSKPHSQDWRSGRVYHITTATHQRLPVFSDFHAARLSIRALREAQTREDATTLPSSSISAPGQQAESRTRSFG